MCLWLVKVTKTWINYNNIFRSHMLNGILFFTQERAQPMLFPWQHSQGITGSIFSLLCRIPTHYRKRKKKIWIFLLLFEDSLEKNEMKMSFQQCVLRQLYREKTSCHMSKADAICNFQTGLLVSATVKPSPNWIMGQGYTYRIKLSSFLKGNLVRYPSSISWILTLHLNQAK